MCNSVLMNIFRTEKENFEKYVFTSYYRISGSRCLSWILFTNVKPINFDIVEKPVSLVDAPFARYVREIKTLEDPWTGLWWRVIWWKKDDTCSSVKFMMAKI